MLASQPKVPGSRLKAPVSQPKVLRVSQLEVRARQTLAAALPRLVEMTFRAALASFQPRVAPPRALRQEELRVQRLFLPPHRMTRPLAVAVGCRSWSAGTR